MAKEIIDELNELGEIIGQIDKDIAHKEGRLHKRMYCGLEVKSITRY